MIAVIWAILWEWCMCTKDVCDAAAAKRSFPAATPDSIRVLLVGKSAKKSRKKVIGPPEVASANLPDLEPCRLAGGTPLLKGQDDRRTAR